MDLVVYSTSRAFEQFLDRHLEMQFEFWPQLMPPPKESGKLYLLHISGMELSS